MTEIKTGGLSHLLSQHRLHTADVVDTLIKIPLWRLWLMASMVDPDLSTSFCDDRCMGVKLHLHGINLKCEHVCVCV